MPNRAALSRSVTSDLRELLQSLFVCLMMRPARISSCQAFSSSRRVPIGASHPAPKVARARSFARSQRPRSFVSKDFTIGMMLSLIIRQMSTVCLLERTAQHKMAPECSMTRPPCEFVTNQRLNFPRGVNARHIQAAGVASKAQRRRF